MRSYAARLQGGHTPRGLCSLCTLSSPPTHSHHFTALHLHDCRVLCHVLTITALVLSCTGNTNPPTHTPRPLLESHYRATHVNYFFPLLLCLTQTLSVFFLSRAHILPQAQSEREEDGWHVSRGEADGVICYNSALISIFLNPLCRFIFAARKSIHLGWALAGHNFARVTWSMFSLASRTSLEVTWASVKLG